jgi:hypothetical protein
MAGTHEEFSVSFPTDGATEVGAIDREGLEGLLIDAPQPGCCQRVLATPDQRGRIVEGDLRGMANGRLTMALATPPAATLMSINRCRRVISDVELSS